MCCLLSDRKITDNSIENDNNTKDNKNKLNNTAKQIEGFQTTVSNINSNNVETIVPNNTRRNSKNQDVLIDIGEFEKCKYWFSEILKYSVCDYNKYGKNKLEWCD
jgi:hypothetical protein